MVFSGSAGCPTFSPNLFKADLCQVRTTKREKRENENDLSRNLQIIVECKKRKTSKQIKVCQNKIQSHSNATSDQVKVFRIALRELLS